MKSVLSISDCLVTATGGREASQGAERTHERNGVSDLSLKMCFAYFGVIHPLRFSSQLEGVLLG